jgi:hypothetical protein
MLGAVAHVYNPSYSGGKDWEDPGLRLVQAKFANNKVCQPIAGHGVACLSPC